jgi:hypothetical protein
MRHIRTSAPIAAFLLLLAAPAAAQPVTFAWHDGTPEGSFQGLAAGDAEAARFTAEHPCRLLRARLRFAGGGPVDVWVWADSGGLEPDFTRTFAGPLRVTAVDGEWTEVDLGGVRVDPPQSFFVGIVHEGAAPALLVDVDGPHAGEGRNVLYVYFEDLRKKIWAGAEGAFLVEADVEYVDVIAPQDRWFRDVTEAAGVVPGGRVAWPDYDGDGDPDLAFDGVRLLRNNGDGTFTDVSAAAGLAGVPSNGGVWADYDNDGDLDLYATVSSWQSADPARHDRLFRNNGDGTFTDVSDEAGAPYDDLPTEAAAWGDYDGDGFVDLYVANYEVPGATLGIGTTDFLWRNQGDGTFRDVSVESGIRAVAAQCGRGLAWADFDQDGDLDLYVSNYRLDPNFLWVNQGDGTFREQALDHGLRGVSKPAYRDTYGHTIGSVWGDLDLDGDLDLVAANLAHPRFLEFSDKTMIYRATTSPAGGLAFEDVRAAAGVAYAETDSNPALGDVDNDGDLDLYLTRVYEQRPSVLYRNEWVPAAGQEAGFRFTDVTYPSGTLRTNGWGSAFADYDGDGALDLVAGRLYRNEPGAAGHWLGVHLEGTTSNRAAIGARLAVSAGGRVFVRQVEGGSGTGCQPPLTQHVGLGATETVDRLVVRWPGGAREVFEGPFAADQRLHLVEGGSVAPPPVDAGGGSPDTAAGGPDAGAAADRVAPPPDDAAGGPDAADAVDTSVGTDSGAGGGGGGGGGCNAGGPEPAGAGALLLLAVALVRLPRRARRRA